MIPRVLNAILLYFVVQKSRETNWLYAQDARAVATAQIHVQTEKEITVK